MVDKETVLELGVEGGGATIFRTRSDTGEWHFHVEGSSMYLDENDDEVWRSWSCEPVRSIEEALREVIVGIGLEVEVPQLSQIMNADERITATDIVIEKLERLVFGERQ